MKEAILLLLLLSTETYSQNQTHHEDCKSRRLSQPASPARLNFNVTELSNRIFNDILHLKHNFTTISRQILSQYKDVFALILSNANERIFSSNIGGRLKVFHGYKSVVVGAFWGHFNQTGNGWSAPFKDCLLTNNTWYYQYKLKSDNADVAFFIRIELNPCDDGLSEIYNGTHRCEETTFCVPIPGYGEKRGGYRCLCRHGYFYPQASRNWSGFGGEDVESGSIDSPRCVPCPEKCDYCGQNGQCLARREVYLKTIILSFHLGCMGLTIIVGFFIFKHRKSKAISSGMWTILETILLGICILYSSMVVRFFEPSVIQCLLEPWAREMGFIICYGAIILKMYRHLIEFRTRKAHRWVVKDTDLLKYLLVMVLSVLAYMAAYTAFSLNFVQENFSMLYQTVTTDGLQYEACKPLFWDFVTETGEIVILIFGIHLSYSTRNARTQFQERSFLCAAISIELAVSTIFYVSRALFFPQLHPDVIFIIYCARTQLTTTSTLLLVFVPKFWYQQKQVRNLAQEYSCRLPVDAFKDINAHGPLTGNNSDIEMGEITIADMNPDDIRAELKRLYMQLEVLKSKTLCLDNPHISKRRGGRKTAHRRFSLQKKGSREKDAAGTIQPSSSTKTKRWSSVRTVSQRCSEINLHSKRAHKHHEETTEAEQSRTPEDSVCSIEGTSGIYHDLASSTTHTSDPK